MKDHIIDWCSYPALGPLALDFADSRPPEAKNGICLLLLISSTEVCIARVAMEEAG